MLWNCFTPNYITSTDNEIKPYLPELNKAYNDICKFLNIPKEHAEIDKNLYVSTNLWLEYENKPVMKYVTNDTEFNNVLDLLQKKEYYSLITKYGDIRYVNIIDGEHIDIVINIDSNHIVFAILRFFQGRKEYNFYLSENKLQYLFTKEIKKFPIYGLNP